MSWRNQRVVGQVEVEHAAHPHEITISRQALEYRPHGGLVLLDFYGPVGCGKPNAGRTIGSATATASPRTPSPIPRPAPSRLFRVPPAGLPAGLTVRSSQTRKNSPARAYAGATCQRGPSTSSCAPEEAPDEVEPLHQQRAGTSIPEQPDRKRELDLLAPSVGDGVEDEQTAEALWVVDGPVQAVHAPVMGHQRRIPKVQRLQQLLGPFGMTPDLVDLRPVRLVGAGRLSVRRSRPAMRSPRLGSCADTVASGGATHIGWVDHSAGRRAEWSSWTMQPDAGRRSSNPPLRPAEAALPRHTLARSSWVGGRHADGDPASPMELLKPGWSGYGAGPTTWP
jgi:hypothetical protein